MSPIVVGRGDAPLVLSVPHAGTELPDEVARMVASSRTALQDTDWRIDDLYAFAAGLGATTVRTLVSRTAIDVNRDPTGASLYPGQATTGLVPLETFDGRPLYPPGGEPDEAGIARRRDTWFATYHAALDEEIGRLRALHPHIVVYDCHSIRSRVPRLFEGELPVFNIGTNGGTSCDPGLEQAVERACRASGESTVVNGRFRGGWITRRCGRPSEGIHAIQMELAQRFYLDEDQPEKPDAARARRAGRSLRTIVEGALAWARS